MDEKKNHYQLIPKEELKCVWMTAGLLTYKLCKYDLQCERCPLDRELRNLPRPPSLCPTPSQGGEDISPEETSPPLPQEKFLGEDLSQSDVKRFLFYHPGHTWVKVEKADEVRIGIDCFLGKMIGRVKVIVLPLSGRRCFQGENLCSIIQEEGILHIVFPVSGSILSINQKLKDEPDLISRDPLGDGFLLILRPKNLQRDQRHLFFGEAALSWYKKELERFKAAVISEIHHGQNPYRNAPIRGKMFKAGVISELHQSWGSLGMTMQDGEINLRGIEKLIGPERYIQLVSTFLRNGEKDFPRSKHEKGDHSKLQPG